MSIPNAQSYLYIFEGHVHIPKHLNICAYDAIIPMMSFIDATVSNTTLNYPQLWSDIFPDYAFQQVWGVIPLMGIIAVTKYSNLRIRIKEIIACELLAFICNGRNSLALF